MKVRTALFISYLKKNSKTEIHKLVIVQCYTVVNNKCIDGATILLLPKDRLILVANTVVGLLNVPSNILRGFIANRGL